MFSLFSSDSLKRFSDKMQGKFVTTFKILAVEEYMDLTEGEFSQRFDPKDMTATCVRLGGYKSHWSAEGYSKKDDQGEKSLGKATVQWPAKKQLCNTTRQLTR